MKIEVGKVVQLGKLRVGILVKSGKMSRESNVLESCGREKDVAPKLHFLETTRMVLLFRAGWAGLL